MAAHQEPPPRVAEDPATAVDALSLHTIADTDVYASQEQEDADFALALSLEEQESQRYAHTQRTVQGQEPNQVDAPPHLPTESFPPYRDDPDTVIVTDEEGGTPPPYRDDPDADPVQGETGADPEVAAEPARRRRVFFGFARKLFKTWLCCLAFSTILTIVVVVVVFVLAFVHGSKQDPKEAAWQASRSQDYDLKLHKLYPTLEAGANPECKRVWEERAAGLPCHRMILSPAWDNGNADEVNAAAADPFFYSEAVCTSQCRASIRRLEAPLASKCPSRTDRFDFASYGSDGKAYLEKGKIEEGPIHVAKNLLERYDRFCATPPRGRGKTEWTTCAADLWMKWGIVDGKNEAHLHGLDEFLEQTSEKKTIPYERRTVTSLTSTGENWTYSMYIQSREVGPGSRETECGFCTLDWLERKMRSFQFGQILDPATGEALGLSEFRTRMTNAIQRCKGDRPRCRGSLCKGAYTRLALRNVDKKWEEFGWWCYDKPCSLDKPQFSQGTIDILHGMPKDGRVFKGLQDLMNNKDAPRGALQALHDGMMDMPCGIGFTETVAIHEIIPYEHLVQRLCSDQCRNALDRLQNQHGQLFAGLQDDPRYGQYFSYPAKASERVSKVCISSNPNVALQASENLCAPGYAAVGHPEWIFTPPSSHSTILSAFSSSIDELAAKLPSYVRAPKRDPESVRIMSKKLSESACNTCAGDLFIGHEPDWNKVVDAFLDDREVNGTEYVRAAKKGWVTCGKMYGMELSEIQKKSLWKKTGLDRYD